MSNLFGMYSVATRAMQAQSLMISTASHNIANVDTPGFSRQRVDLEASRPFSYLGIGQVGTGVDVQMIKRLRDSFLDVQVRYETSIMSKFNKAQEALDQVEIVFKEPSETGLMSVMNNMWNSWTALASNPEGTTQRSIVAQRADDMAKTMNHMYGQLEELNKNTVSEIEADVYNANTLLAEIQDTCSQIYSIKLQGMQPNDLLDRRDLLLEKLSNFVNIDVEEDQFGRVRITEADSGEAYELLNYSKDTPPEYYMATIRSAECTAAGSPASWHFSVVVNGEARDIDVQGDFNVDFKAGDVIMCETGGLIEDGYFDAEGPYRPNLGSIAGAQMAISKTEGYMADLDNMAYTIASAINTLHATEEDDDDIPFFTVIDAAGDPPSFPATVDSTKGAAKNIKVSDEIMNDVSLIKSGMEGSAVGDVRRANAISQLQDVKFNMIDLEAFHDQLTFYDAGTLKIEPAAGGSTTSGFYTDLIGKIGIDSESSQRNIVNQETLILQLKSKQASTSGVSIDEEVANLMQFQTAYQANARVMNTITTMLDTLIGLTQ